MLQKSCLNTSVAAEPSTTKHGYSTSVLNIAVWYNHLNTATNTDNMISQMWQLLKIFNGNPHLCLQISQHTVYILFSHNICISVTVNLKY